MNVRSFAAVSALAVLGVLAACTPPPPPPPPTVDQSNVPGAGTFTGGTPVDRTCVIGDDDLVNQAAQTFTAGRSGQLTGVSVVVSRQGAPAPLRVTLRETGTDASFDVTPTDTVLAEATYGGAGSPDAATFIDLTFAAPAPVTAGQVYAVVLDTPGCASPLEVNRWIALGAGADTYAAGEGLQRRSETAFPLTFWDPIVGGFPPGVVDLYFRTLVA